MNFNDVSIDQKQVNQAVETTYLLLRRCSTRPCKAQYLMLLEHETANFFHALRQVKCAVGTPRLGSVPST